MVGFVYAIGSRAEFVECIKIGYATDVNRRYRDLQIGSPIKLEILAVWEFDTVREARRAEMVAHRKFRSRNSHGEWFNVDLNTVVAFMDAGSRQAFCYGPLPEVRGRRVDQHNATASRSASERLLKSKTQRRSPTKAPLQRRRRGAVPPELLLTMLEVRAAKTPRQAGGSDD